METAIQIITIAYLVGVNIFGFILIRAQKKDVLLAEQKKEILQKYCPSDSCQKDVDPSKPDADTEPTMTEAEASRQIEQITVTEKDLRKDKSKRPVKDFQLILVAILGGALAIYLGMFLMQYKLKNMLLMLLIPAILGLNTAVVYGIFRFTNGFFYVDPIDLKIETIASPISDCPEFIPRHLPRFSQ